MKKVVVTYKDDDYDVELTIRQATVMDGMDRSANMALIHAQPFDVGKASNTDRFRRFMLMQTYSACLAVTEIVNHGTKKLKKDISPDDFLELPDGLVVPWDNTVFELNPHWVMRTKEDDEKSSGEVLAPSAAKS